MPIIERKEIAENITEILLSREGQNFNFVPGQYVRITIPALDKGIHKGNTRDFSIASSPTTKGHIAIIFRNSDSPFKKCLLEVPLGEKVNIQGPLGVFILPEDPSVPIVFLAAGLGVTPALSMLRYINASQLQTQIQLVYANSKPERAVYAEEMKEIASRCTNIKLFEVSGRIDIPFLQKTILSGGGSLWYLCGVSEMVRKFAYELPLKLDIAYENLRIEEYPGYQKENLSEYKVSPPVEAAGQEVRAEEFFENKSLAKALFNVTSQGALVAVTDAQGTIEFVNDKFIEVSKYTKDELIGQNHRILKSGLHPPEFYAELWKTISSGKQWDGDIKNRAKDGSYYWVQASIAPILNEKDEIYKYLAVRFVITEQKDLEVSKRAVLNILGDFEEEKSKFERLSSRLELATQSANIGVWEWNFKKNTWDASKEFYGIYESEPDSFMPPFEGWMNFVHPDEKEAVTEKIKGSITSPINLNTIFRILLKGEIEKNIKVAASVEKGSDGEPEKLIGVAWDVTNETRVDQMKSDFISLVSHQLRTPLTAIKWYSEMLLKGDVGQMSPEQGEVIKGLAESAERMIVLVKGLLNISRVESGRLNVDPKPIELKPIIETLLSELKPKIEAKKIQVELDIPEDIPTISVDPKLMVEIYQNLISNAIQYTPDEGKITVKLSQNEAEILSQISDTGYGVPNGAKDKIFQRFFRAENILKVQTDGTGLGLYLTKMLVIVSGGNIWFDSEEGKGSTFSFTLPKAGSKPNKGVVAVE